MRPIDADALVEAMTKFSDATGEDVTHGIFYTHIAPTIDAVPVRHGKWIDMDEQSYTWKIRCSCCDHERSMMSTQGEYPNYCENCGARMDGTQRKPCDDCQQFDCYGCEYAERKEE